MIKDNYTFLLVDKVSIKWKVHLHEDKWPPLNNDQLLWRGGGVTKNEVYSILKLN